MQYGNEKMYRLTFDVTCQISTFLFHLKDGWVEKADGDLKNKKQKKDLKRYENQILTPHILTSVLLLHREVILSDISTIHEEVFPAFCTAFKMVLK